MPTQKACFPFVALIFLLYFNSLIAKLPFIVSYIISFEKRDYYIIFKNKPPHEQSPKYVYSIPWISSRTKRLVDY